MLEFIKMFGLGILYTILSPLILAIFLVFVVYSFFNYLVLEVINFFGFFAGKRFSVETKEEKEMKKKILAKQKSVEQTGTSSYNQDLDSKVTGLNDIDTKGGDLNA